MAPPRVPNEQKKRRGTLRGDRTVAPLATIDRVAVDTPAPATLKTAGAEEWRRALRVCPWLGYSDLKTLELYCRAIDRFQSFADLLEKQDLTLETSTGYFYLNPLVAGLQQAEERLFKWSDKLGLTPSSRSAIGVSEVKAASVLDDIARRNRGKSAPVTIEHQG